MKLKRGGLQAGLDDALGQPVQDGVGRPADENPELAFLAVGSLPPFKTTENRLKRQIRWMRAVISLLTVLTIIFLSLYLYENGLFERRCREQFTLSCIRINAILEESLDNDFDIETKYRELTAELNTAQLFLAYTDAAVGQKKCMSDIYYASVKLPNQIKSGMRELYEGISLILALRQDEGFTVLQAFVSNLDLLDYGE